MLTPIQDSQIGFCGSDEVKEVCKTVRNAKSGIGPCLLIMFTLNCITIINSFLVIATELDNLAIMILQLADMLLTALDLVYVTLIIENTSVVFKEYAIKLR